MWSCASAASAASTPAPATSSTSAPASCGGFRQTLRILDSSGAVKWRGKMRLRYARTWLEVDPAGNDLQVWRFLVNGDLRPNGTMGSADEQNNEGSQVQMRRPSEHSWDEIHAQDVR